MQCARARSNAAEIEIRENVCTVVRTTVQTVCKQCKVQAQCARLQCSVEGRRCATELNSVQWN